MNDRHEWKHEITVSDMIQLRQRLRAVMKPDEHGSDGKYHIRSLYFDTPSDKALREKINGINRREKFRLRYYNLDPSWIRLEKKSKVNGLCRKESAVITVEEAQKLMNGKLDWMVVSDKPLVRELYAKMRSQLLRPKTIVDYTREAFTYGPGNVRVTLDYDIRTGLGCTDFLNPHCITIPAGAVPIILEVKWDAFLPDVIRDALQLENRRAGAFSKYAACRVYY